jgi:hypothetical protein
MHSTCEALSSNPTLKKKKERNIIISAQLINTKVADTARYQWFTPIIIATWEAEIRRIAVPARPA